MYPSSALLGQDKDESISALPIDELIEKADGFAGVFPGTSLYFLLLRLILIVSYLGLLHSNELQFCFLTFMELSCYFRAQI